MAIRPSIYIGLGGTGLAAVSYAKKLYEQAYKGVDNIPGQIAFAAIDFDLAAPEDPNLATDMHDDFLSFANVAAASPKTLYDVRSQRGDFAWMFPSNTRYLGNRISDGASQVRTYGRFLTEMIQDNIIRRISDCITQVRNIQATLDASEVVNQPIDIHIAMSLAGGTGAGSFLNVAQLIREKYQNQVHIIGYGILHSVFRAMDPSGNKTPRVIANAYSSIMDLDYLMGASSENPIKVSLNGRSRELRQPIYDEFYVIDNETENGKKVDHINKLCEVVGLSMYVSGGEMGNKVRSGASNTGWQQGSYNITPKLGWVQGLGACQVVYKGQELAEVYSLKAALHLITNLQNISLDVDKAAIDWALENKIREDLNFDQLIDSIYDLKKVNISPAPLDTEDSISDIKQAVERYVKSRPQFPDNKVIDTRIESLRKSLQDRVKTLVHAENGVANTKGFLSTLITNLSIYRTEMDTERSLCEKNAQDKQVALKKEYKDYEEYSKKIFKSKKNKAIMLEDGIGKIARDILIDNLEAERRKVAAEIYTNLLTGAGSLHDRIEDLDNKLSALKKQYKDELTSKQNDSAAVHVFEYDLSAQERQTMEFLPDEAFYDGFFNSLGKSIMNVDVNKELHGKIHDYCLSLPQAKAYCDKLIVDVVNELSDKEYADFKKIVSEKSSRLLRLDDRGQLSETRGMLPTAMMVQNYLISIYKNDSNQKTRLESDRTLLPDIKKEFIFSEFDSMKQKIIFYRSDMAIIPYCIGAFDENTIDREYSVLVRDAMTAGTTSFNPHFDKQIFDTMRSMDFKLKPEMQNEVEFYWVCGNFFGWTDVTETQYVMEKDSNRKPIKIESKEDVSHTKYIRCYKGKYQVWNEDGTAMTLDGKWTALGNTTQREKAFNYFKTIVFPELRNTLHDKILNDIRSKGKEVYKIMIQSVIDDGMADYIDKIACTDKNSLTYFSKQNGETERFVKEWEFIQKDFINSIENFK